MSLPLGGGGVTPDDWWLHQGAVAPVSSMSTARGQTAMTEYYKTLVKNSGGYQGAKTGVWDGLNPALPLPLAIIQALLEAAFVGITAPFTSVAEALTEAATNFGDKWTGIIDAKNAASYALAQLAVSNRPIVDLFDRPVGAPGSNWDVFNNLGPGGGYPELDGNGNLGWHAAGPSFTGKTAMRWNVMTTSTDNQVISTVTPNRVQDTFLGQASYATLCGRVNDTGPVDTYVGGEYSATGAKVCCLVAGTRTDFGTNPVSVADNDTWDFYVGDADPHHFVLVRNGIPVVDVDSTDGTTTAQSGPGYQSVGLVLEAGDRSLLTTQTLPGTLAVFSADDN